MGIFPVEFPTTTADSFESFRVLHYLAFIKEEDVLIETGLFTTEDAEDTKVNLGHFCTEMNYNGLPAYVVNQNKSSKR